MTAAKVAMSAAFSLMMAMTLFQVVNRYAIGLPVFWTEELIVFLLIWATMLGLPVQLWEHKEIVVDFIEFPSAGADRIKTLLGAFASLAFCAVLAWSGWAFAARGWNVTSPALGLSRFWFFVPISFCAALSVLALLVRRKDKSIGGFD
ncbi:MAG: TRAP transporter small permease [Pseudomonadota bacterium]|nr:TRAP transporter small permease [Pseudomonadota bacterium]